jgi:hypothetical protein
MMLLIEGLRLSLDGNKSDVRLVPALDVEGNEVGSGARYSKLGLMEDRHSPEREGRR